MELTAVTPLTPPATHEERLQTATRIADKMFQQQPDWITFFREVLGVDGLVRKLFTTPEELAEFEKTARVRRNPAHAGQAPRTVGRCRRRQGADARDYGPPAEEPARVAAGRGPRPQDQHEPALHQQAAAGDRRRAGAQRNSLSQIRERHSVGLGRRMRRSARPPFAPAAEKRSRSGPVSRVLSARVPVGLRARDGHFSRTPIARRLKQPTRESNRAGPARALAACDATRTLCLALLRVGFA